MRCSFLHYECYPRQRRMRFNGTIISREGDTFTILPDRNPLMLSDGLGALLKHASSDAVKVYLEGEVLPVEEEGTV